MSNELSLSITKTIPAPRQKVFDAWLAPEALTQFMTPGPEMTVPKAETDPRVGGSFLIVMKAGEQEIEHRGEYLEIDRHDRLVFTWISGHTQPGSTVTLTFEELSPKETKLTLHHVGFPSEQSRDNHRGGWTAIAEKLSVVVS